MNGRRGWAGCWLLVALAGGCDAAEPRLDAALPRDGGAALDASRDAGTDAAARDADTDAASGDAAADDDAGLADAGVGCPLGPDPRIQPSGFTEYERSWAEVFDGRAFPDTPSFAMPVGAWTISRDYASPQSAGMYITIPIDLPADRSLNILAVGAVPASSIGYGMPRRGNVFVSLSPCPGDVRPLDPEAADVYARACRGSLYESSITFNTRAAGSCRVSPGRYWLTFMHADPSASDFSPTSTSCDSGASACESSLSASLR